MKRRRRPRRPADIVVPLSPAYAAYLRRVCALSGQSVGTVLRVFIALGLWRARQEGRTDEPLPPETKYLQ